MSDNSKQSIPVLEFDWNDDGIRHIAANIYHAQMAGWPAVLTYDREHNDVERKKEMGVKRRSAMTVTLEDVQGVKGAEWLAKDIAENGQLHVPTIRNADPALNLPSRDEYPFACTKEHRGKVWVGHVPPEQNSRQGNMINQFLKNHDARDGFAFAVKVVNFPKTSPGSG